MSSVGDAVSSSPPQHHLTAAEFAQLPPFLVHTYDFLRHFVLFFIFPIVTIVFSAIFAAALAKWIYRAIFARYATPSELLDHALAELKKNEGKRVINRTFSTRRDRALDTLRLVIQLNENSNGCKDDNDDKLKPYIVLATELFYGEIKHCSGDGPSRPGMSVPGNSLRQRDSQRLLQRQQAPKDISPALIECQEIIKKGLQIDPQNESLLNLQTELRLVSEHGSDGSHAKMMNVGSFGWMSG